MGCGSLDVMRPHGAVCRYVAFGALGGPGGSGAAPLVSLESSMYATRVAGDSWWGAHGLSWGRVGLPGRLVWVSGDPWRFPAVHWEAVGKALGVH